MRTDRRTSAIGQGRVGGAVLRTAFAAAILTTSTALVGCQKDGSAARKGPSYLELRAALPLDLARTGPSPQEWEAEPPPPGIEEVTYPSGGANLKGWVRTATDGAATRHPALLYLHGGFAASPTELLATDAFHAAGFVVMLPALRGENGNPGNYELFRGEVDDCVAAAKFLAARPDVDPARIYAFGHSVGGGLAALLSLMDDVPLRHTASCGGLYGDAAFGAWQADDPHYVPFDLVNADQRRVRLLLGNVRDMRRPHFAFVGLDDEGLASFLPQAEKEIGGDSKLSLHRVPGDHLTSHDPALRTYLLRIQQEPATPSPTESGPESGVGTPTVAATDPPSQATPPNVRPTNSEPTTDPAVPTKTEPSAAVVSLAPLGPPWAVLSKLKAEIGSPPDVRFTMRYQFAQGSPDPAEQYVFLLTHADGEEETKIAFDVRLEPKGGEIEALGRVEIPLKAEKLVAQLVRRVGPETFDPISGDLKVGQTASLAQVPANLVLSANAKALQRMSVVGNASLVGQGGGRGRAKMDFTLRNAPPVGSRLFWVIAVSGSSSVSLDVTPQTLGSETGSGTLEADVSFTAGVGNGGSMRFELAIPGAAFGTSRSVVSNVVAIGAVP